MNNSTLTNDIRYTLHLHLCDRFISARKLQERKQKSESALSFFGCFCQRDILSTYVAGGWHHSAATTLHNALTMMQKGNISCLSDDGKF